MEIIEINISDGDLLAMGRYVPGDDKQNEAARHQIQSDIKSLHSAFLQASEPYKSLSEEMKVWLLNWSLAGCHQLKEKANGDCTAVTRAARSLGDFSRNQIEIIDATGRLWAVRKDLGERIVSILSDLFFYGPDRASALDWMMFGLAIRGYYENQN